MNTKTKLSVSEVRRLADAAFVRSRDTRGRADAELSHQLRALEAECDFSPQAAALFQQLLAELGVASNRSIGLPLDHQPYWLRSGHPLANYQSRPDLPATADVVIIGAGLTGASTAYHLAEAARTRGVRIVVLDQGDPAGEASGRNGGNFELIPENCVGIYEGLARERLIFLRQCYPALPEAVRQAESERQASLVFDLAVRNRERLKTIVQQERIACDFSPRGWLYLAHTEREEQALCEEVTLAAQHGQRIELWSRRRIREEFGFNTAYLGRFIPGDGTYHPFKYVCGLLQSALRSGVQLYTRRRVRALVTEASGRVRVVIDDGAILASSVVVATNAFSSVGQVSLIDGQPRSASCSMRHAGVLLEMEQAPCARLFAGRSPTALKFLAAVNQGLIAALRGADRRLMRLQGDSKPGSDSDLPGTPDAIPA